MSKRQNRTQRLTVPSSVSSNIAAQTHKRLDSQPVPRTKLPATKLILQRETPTGEHSSSPGESDTDDVITILAAEFPLLDEALIRAILSDHPADQLHSHMDQIREDLDLLQASVVPDPDAASYQADLKSEHTSQTSWLPSGIESRTCSDEASSKTSFIEHKEETEESQAIQATVAGTKRVTRSAACSETLDGEERLPSSRPESVYDELDEASSADIERWLADADAYSPLDFLYEMFSHLEHRQILKAYQNHSEELRDKDDLTHIVEELLSVEAIQCVEQADIQSCEKEQRKSEMPQMAELEETDWLNFFIRPEPALPSTSPAEQDPDQGNEDGKEVVQPTMPSLQEASGPRPNDTHMLPLNTQMYSRIRQPLASTPPASDTESVEEAGGAPQVQKPKAVNSGRYAMLASAKRETYGGFSSGDESTGSVERRSRKQQSSRVLPLRDFEHGAIPGPPGPSRRHPADGNTWNKIQSLATYLAELVDQPSADASFFLTYVHSPRYPGGYAAVKEALKHVAGSTKDLKAELKMVRDIRGGIEESATVRTSPDDINICVGAARDVSRALDLLALLEEIKTWGSGSLDGLGWNQSTPDPEVVRSTESSTAGAGQHKETKPLAAGQRAFPADPRPPRRKNKDEHPQNWRVVRKDKERKPKSMSRLAEFIPSYSRATFGSETNLFDLDECRRRALEERSKREAAVRQAGRHFRSGTHSGVHGKQVASFYASEARRYEASARSWELRAAEEIVKQQSKSDGAFSIDLHGLTLEEAKRVATDRTQMWHASQNYASVPAKPFQIITGQGKHSVNYVGILGPGVANELERAGWFVDRGYSGRGYIVVRGVRG